MTKKRIRWAILAVTVLLALLMILTLPPEIAVQWDSRGNVSNTLSKYAAAAINVGLCLLGMQTWDMLETRCGQTARASRLYAALLWLAGALLAALGVFGSLLCLFKN